MDNQPKRIAVAVLLDTNGNVILQKRSAPTPDGQAIIGLFGGHMEGTETPLQALERELQEELPGHRLAAPPQKIAEHHWYVGTLQQPPPSATEGEVTVLSVQDALQLDNLSYSARYALMRLQNDNKL